MITSRDNPRLKLARKLLSARKHRDETGLFAAEGEDLVEAAAAAGVHPVDLLVAGETVAPELLAAVSTLPHPARAIGLYRRADLPAGVRDVTVALWHVGDPGNVGTIIRSADAFDAAVALSAGCADPLGPKALRASAGAVFRVPLLRFEDAPGAWIALDPHAGEPMPEADLTLPLTFVLGAERAGLPETLVPDRCMRVSIPTPGPAESLNVAAAAAIALYELSRRSD